MLNSIHLNDTRHWSSSLHSRRSPMVEKTLVTLSFSSHFIHQDPFPNAPIMSSLRPGQVNFIKATVPVLQEHGNEITTRLYQNMLAEIPDLNNGKFIISLEFSINNLSCRIVFNQPNQFNGHQAAALAGSLYAYTAHIDDLGVLSPAMERISQNTPLFMCNPSSAT